MRKAHTTDMAPAAIGPYSQAVHASGNFVFCSGSIPLTPEGLLIQGDIKDQTNQVMKNIQAMMASLELNMGSIVKTTIYLTSMDDFKIVNEVYGSYFDSEPPARSTVAVSALPMGVDVEIEVVAVR